ncbi:hypothetical protein ACFRU3_36085 [Streptomyces sp. NPDC056910]|uniref:hypothetical protein n=1 Tax=Streptomyces sp. NPDC056910 TaxID=3345964 RepID=UPI00369BE48E
MVLLDALEDVVVSSVDTGPLFSRRRHTNLVLTRTYLLFVLTSLCVYTVLWGVTQWLQVARGMSSKEAGLLLLTMSALLTLLVRPISRRDLIRSTAPGRAPGRSIEEWAVGPPLLTAGCTG